MKRRKLRKWVKVVSTILLMIIGYIVYRLSWIIGALAVENQTFAILNILVWAYLLFGQIAIIFMVWDD